ncbi:Sodium- and chloride-dependent GABA transporter 1 [Coemansia brasiliensis]|uniref:Sodium- and chloride-dependent GABA transporter 1 n=1 Tax=Coemansia brasiliensis TaxID=2650707 RepID=A0A9W8M1F6_9FUNG|nr:Sodium- and chloride-dependent GABA transporter 1 [Coemansia brasiliensis]
MDPKDTFSFSTSSDISDLLLLISQPPPLSTSVTSSLALDNLLANMATPVETKPILSTSEEPTSMTAKSSSTNSIDGMSTTEYANSPGSQSLLPTRVPSFNDINGMAGSSQLSQQPAISPLQPSILDIGPPLQFSMSEINGTTAPGIRHSMVSMPSGQGMPFVLTPTHERRVLRRHSRSAPHPYIPEHPSRRNSTVSAYPSQRSSRCIVPSINQDGSYKCCANCLTAETPSWRRHPETQQLLCNACGLYLRLHRKSRPITIDEAGHIQVIRKNAAVQRDPINLASQSNGTVERMSYMPPQQQHASLASAQLGSFSSLRTTSSNASLQDIGEYSNVDFMFAPSPSYSNVNQPRLTENMMHLHIADSRNEFPASYSTNSGWIPSEISSVNQPSSSAVDDDLVKALQAVKDKTCAEN